MNTRAPMELVVLNIGLDLGFIPPEVFTMLVIMAVATTLMTGPLLGLAYRRSGRSLGMVMEGWKTLDGRQACLGISALGAEHLQLGRHVLSA